MSRRRPNKQRRRRSPEPLADLGRGAAARCLPQEPRCWPRGEARSSGEPPQEGRHRNSRQPENEEDRRSAMAEIRLLNDAAVVLVIRSAARPLADQSGFSSLPLQKPGATTEGEAL